VDPDLAQRLRDEMLFEEYGGAMANVPFTETEKNKKSSPPSNPDDYAVKDFDYARQQFEVVDAWYTRYRSVRASDLESIVVDGEDLVAAFKRLAKRLEKESQSRKSIGANLAAEELEIRLKQSRT
jgi:hypothetical protein